MLLVCDCEERDGSFYFPSRSVAPNLRFGSGLVVHFSDPDLLEFYLEFVLPYLEPLGKTLVSWYGFESRLSSFERLGKGSASFL